MAAPVICGADAFIVENILCWHSHLSKHKFLFWGKTKQELDYALVSPLYLEGGFCICRVSS